MNRNFSIADAYGMYPGLYPGIYPGMHPGIYPGMHPVIYPGIYPSAGPSRFFTPPTIPSLTYKIPRVVPNQRLKFQTNELFRQLSIASEILYTEHRDFSINERRVQLINGCRAGHVELVFTNTGTNVQLSFQPNENLFRECDFEREKYNNINIISSFIMDGVCVRFRGWINVERLGGVGVLEYDEELAEQQDAIRRQQVYQFQQMGDFNRHHYQPWTHN